MNGGKELLVLVRQDDAPDEADEEEAQTTVMRQMYEHTSFTL
jgi:hypothetical protein